MAHGEEREKHAHGQTNKYLFHVCLPGSIISILRPSSAFLMSKGYPMNVAQLWRK
jgi:hypothetical protein